MYNIAGTNCTLKELTLAELEQLDGVLVSGDFTKTETLIKIISIIVTPQVDASQCDETTAQQILKDFFLERKKKMISTQAFFSELTNELKS